MHSFFSKRMLVTSIQSFSFGLNLMSHTVYSCFLSTDEEAAALKHMNILLNFFICLLIQISICSVLFNFKFWHN